MKCVHAKTRPGFLWKQFAEEKQWDEGTKKSIMKCFRGAMKATANE